MEEKDLMRRGITFGPIISATLLALFVAFVAPIVGHAQQRGVYTPGMNATNSGVIPEPGLTYANLFQLYSFSKLKGPNGESLPVNGSVSVFIDQNISIWILQVLSKQAVALNLGAKARQPTGG